MLIWICALHCEAKPVIDHYRLKKSSRHRAFDLFHNDDMSCVVSGIGKTGAAAATAWAAGLQHHSSSLCWINLGIAGSAEKEPGEIFLLNKIIDQQTGYSFYPVPIFSSDIDLAHCLSLDKPSTSYLPDTLYDMEASAFFSTATRFSSAELVHSLKVISDNPYHPPARDKAQISELIYRQITGISVFAEKLNGINREMIKLQSMPDIWQSLNQRLHFSQTQQAQLKSLLGYLKHCDNSQEDIFGDLGNYKSARDIIHVLQQRCHRHSRNL